MSATIKTELSLTDSGVVQGFKEAAASVKKFREDVKKDMEATSAAVGNSFRKLSTSDLPVLDTATQNMIIRAKEQNRMLREGGMAARFNGQGMLQLAQFADDAQYGIKGVLNNIPGLVMGMGATAGVAGAVSLAVLALAKFGPALLEATGIIDGADQASARMTNSFNRTVSSIRAKQAAMKEEQAVMKAYAAEIATMRKQVEEFSRVDSSAAEAEIGRMRARVEAAQALVRARAKVAASRTGDAIEKGKITQAAENQTGQSDIDALREEVARRKQLQTEMASQAQKLYEQQNVMNKALQDQTNLLAEAEKVQKRLFAAQRNAATARAQEEAAKSTAGSGKARDGLNKFASTEEATAAQLERELQMLREKANQMGQLATESKKQWQDAESANTKAMAAEAAKIRQLEEQILQKKELHALAVEAARNEAIAAEKAAAAAKAAKQAAEDKKRQDAEMEQARKAVTAAQAEANYVNETKIAELRRAGNEEAANALEKEIKIRRDAAALEADGVDSARAMAMARARARAEEKRDAVGGESGRRWTPAGRIGMRENMRQYAAEGRLLPTRIGGLSGGGLRREAQGAEAQAARAAAAKLNPHETAAMKYYDNSLQKQSELLEVFKKLGVI